MTLDHVPAWQGWHVLRLGAPVVTDHVPATHAVQVCAPAAAQVPGGQSAHVSLLAAPMAVDHVPAGHASHTVTSEAPATVE